MASPQSSELTTSPDGQPPRRAMFIVFLVVFIDLLGFGIVLPILPRIAEQYLPKDWSPVLQGISIAVLYSAFSAMQFLFSPMWGRLSDRIGRKPVLTIGLAGSVVFYALFGLAADLPAGVSTTVGLVLILIARAGAGIAGATIAVAQAVIADCTTPEKRSRGMALIGAAFGIGFTFGPLLAFAALEIMPNLQGGVGYIASGLSLIALIACIRLLPETRMPGAPSAARHGLNMGRLTATLNTPGIGLLVLIFFLATFAFATFEATLSLLTKRFGYTDKRNFLVFAFIGFALVIANGVYRSIAKRSPERALLRMGVLLMLAGLGGLAYVASQVTSETSTPSEWLFYVTLAISVCGFAFMTPSVQSLISRRSDADRQGEVLGINQSFAALARILGPMIGLIIFPLTAAPLLPYAMAAGLLGIAGILTLRLPAVERN